MRRSRHTLVLFLVFLALACYAFFFERGRPTEQEKKEARLTVLKADTSEIKTIGFITGTDTVICVRRDGEWRITKPLGTRADQPNVRSVLQRLGHLKVDRFLQSADTDLSTYGLAPPAIQVSYGPDEHTISNTVKIGNANPAKDAFYGTLEKDPRVFLVPAYVVEGSFRRSLHDLRDKSALRFDPEEVTELTIRRKGNAEIVCRKGPDGSWELVSPLSAPGDPEHIASTLRATKAARIKEFIAEKPTTLAEYGLDSPRLSISLKLRGEDSRRSLLLGKVEKEKDCYFAKVDSRPGVFLLPVSSFARLDSGLDYLRDKRICPFERYSAVSLRVASRDSSVFFVRDSADVEKWTMVEPRKEKLEGWRVNFLLNKLGSLRAERIVEEHATGPERHGLSNPRLRAEIGFKDGSNVILIFGDPAERQGEYYGSSSVREWIFTVKKKTLDEVRESLERPPYAPEPPPG